MGDTCALIVAVGRRYTAVLLRDSSRHVCSS